jgi:UDP-N-acetylglucosamine acyltransferase
MVKNIGQNNIISSSAIIHDDIEIGDNNFIGDNVIIYPNTTIGNNNQFFNGNVIGDFPVNASDGWDSYNLYKCKGVLIGNDNIFHIKNIIFSGMENKTIIGNNNKFLSEVTVHHDNNIHNNVVLYPRAMTAGFCTLLDYSTMGMNSCLQQKSVLGSFAMIGMGNSASHNIFPFYIYFNQRYKRLNTKKIPIELQVEKYDNILINLIKELKSNNCDNIIVKKYNLPENINNYIYEFIDNIKINKI